MLTYVSSTLGLELCVLQLFGFVRQTLNGPALAVATLASQINNGSLTPPAGSISLPSWPKSWICDDRSNHVMQS